MEITSPLDPEVIEKLKAGDQVFISGMIYTARDAAHKRLIEALDRGEEPPFDFRGQTLYYMGPSPAKPGQVIGAAGPTTSGRMDVYSPRLIAAGLKGMIGKGSRSKEVKEAIKEHKAVYLAAIGGAGAGPDQDESAGQDRSPNHAQRHDRQTGGRLRGRSETSSGHRAERCPRLRLGLWGAGVKPLTAGSEIDAWCTKCRMDLLHRIVAMVRGRPKRVICMTCNSEHNYRELLPYQH